MTEPHWEIAEAHRMLDRADVPREDDRGNVLDLAQRIIVLRSSSVRARVQWIRGMCSDEAPYPEIDAALAGLLDMLG